MSMFNTPAERKRALRRILESWELFFYEQSDPDPEGSARDVVRAELRIARDEALKRLLAMTKKGLR
jgi:hypothetical protein